MLLATTAITVCNFGGKCLQLNEYETAPNFIQLLPKLDIELFVDFCVFAWCDHKIVLFWSAEQYSDHIMQKQVKTQKSTNNLISSFGLIE